MTNLRLPGQYDERLLGSVGLQGPYYNWNRWYLPSLGRHLELDPIAKAGGFNGFYGPNWYGYAEGNPLRYVDPFGLDACVITYLMYPITIPGTSISLPMGHSGALTFDPKTGRTNYFEYGRYGGDFGKVMERRGIPNLVIGPDGQLTQASWDNLMDYLSKNYGKGRGIDSICNKDSNADKANAFARQRARDPNRDPYSWNPLWPNHCLTFALDTVFAGTQP